MAKTRMLVLVVAALGASGCKPSGTARVVGSGNLVTVTPRVEAFDEVQLVGSFQVVVAPGVAPSLSIRTDDNIMPLIDTEVERGVLTIRRRENVEPSDGVTVKIAAPGLLRFAVDGAVSGEIKDVTGDTFAVVVNGVGKLTVTGRVTDLTLAVHGAGGIDATDLEASTVDVTVEGAGRVQTYAVRTLNIKLQGLGVVEYRGDPQVTKSASALARIIKMD